ncbi:Dna2/Cas4 domain-containing protein [Runella sp. CRIBMP]|uniref:Dna2/Cas4 domain-containing protein n=1 Tax=Runella sp. CRIBMP TaxID=2683261 RepID=UPI00286D88E9|nr:Dna2/Cas4 domain-containing protein [Runella sp. CRIBMP]
MGCFIGNVFTAVFATNYININATLVNYYFLCHRKLWLHAHAIRMEHTSEMVYEGKLIGEESYPQRAEKNQEVEISYELPSNAWNLLS